MELEQLLSQVTERATGGDPLVRVAAARDLCFELTTLGDQVVDHVVGQAREQGCPRAQIGSRIGTEHLLLAPLRERKGAAARVLTAHGADRGYLLTVLRSSPGEESQP